MNTILLPSGASSSRSFTWPTSSGLPTTMPFTYVVLSRLMATVTVLGSSLRSAVLLATGSFTSTPFDSIGVITMKMISSTIMMSAMGVTLMSAIAPPLLPPTFMLIGWSPPPPAPGLGALLDEVVEQLGAGVVHLHVEALDL